MNDTMKRYLLSSLTTFVSVAITTLAAQLVVGSGIEWTLTFWTSVLLTATRAGVKAVLEAFTLKPQV